jgi:hypothetical protein
MCVLKSLIFKDKTHQHIKAKSYNEESIFEDCIRM